MTWSENQGERGNHWDKAVTQKSQLEVKADVKHKLAVSWGPWGPALGEMAPNNSTVIDVSSLGPCLAIRAEQPQV